MSRTKHGFYPRLSLWAKSLNCYEFVRLRVWDHIGLNMILMGKCIYLKQNPLPLVVCNEIPKSPNPPFHAGGLKKKPQIWCPEINMLSIYPRYEQALAERDFFKHPLHLAHDKRIVLKLSVRWWMSAIVLGINKPVFAVGGWNSDLLCVSVTVCWPEWSLTHDTRLLVTLTSPNSQEIKRSAEVIRSVNLRAQ